jgi:murein peptide amidase A
MIPPALAASTAGLNRLKQGGRMKSAVIGCLLVCLAAGCCGKRTMTENQPRDPAAPATPPAAREASQPMSMQIGQSVEGRPIILHRFGEGPDLLLVFGGIHGSEPTSVVVAERFAELLRQQPHLWQGHAVAVIPCANPDGLAAGTRTNVNRVDVNRNFPATNWGPSRPGVYHGGPSPASEPETRALIEAIDTLQPTRIISIHSIRRGRHCNNFDGPARPLAELMEQYNGYPVTETMGYPTPGSFGSWAGIDRQIPVITLELPRDQPGEQAWADNREALIAALQQGADVLGAAAGQ